MSYTRVLVIENPLEWAEGIKIFRKSAQPALNAFKKQNVLANWSLVQAGDHTGVLICEFDTKAKMNKYLKVMNDVRKDAAAESGSQNWIYHGPVKASG